MRGYRAWDVANKEMLYPDGNGYFGSEHHLSFVIDGNGKPIYIDDMGTPVEIIFLQQTGIKDSNNTEGCEGDISEDFSTGEKFKIEFVDGAFTLVDKNGVGQEILDLQCQHIIGDIYTTPDLKEQS